MFGNPYRLRRYTREMAMALFRESAQGIWKPQLVESLDEEMAASTYEAHCHWMAHMERHPIEVIQRELRGWDLSCWCSLSDECHADTLLEIANR